MSGGVKHACDQKLIELLALGHTPESAGKQANVSTRTVLRRLQNAEFRGRVDALRGQALERAAGALANAAVSAVATLDELSKSAKSEHVRRQAARDILDCAPSLRADTALEARLAALEEAIGSEQKGTRWAG